MKVMDPSAFPPAELEAETERLFKALMHADCTPGRTWNYEACRGFAPLTLEINRLKKEKGASASANSFNA